MKKLLLLASLSLLVLTSGCVSEIERRDPPTAVQNQSKDYGKIYLYGEMHGESKIYEKELELWNRYYNQGMRHLFIEFPYYTAEYLNLWMQSDGDEILNQLFNDWYGAAAGNPYILDFFRNIKENCPETVFHGTDVGHNYETTGARYLEYLERQGLVDSENYALALESIEQGKTFNGVIGDDFTYRENSMAKNFIREFNKLGGEDIMGIYGNAHAGVGGMEYYNGLVPNMAAQIYDTYGDNLYTEALDWVIRDIDPIRTDVLEVNGKEYQAAYYGSVDLDIEGYRSREFWRLEDAYEDFKDMPLTGNFLPYHNYPMLIDAGQVFVVDYTLTDGSVRRDYLRSDGAAWKGMESTSEFEIE